MTKLVIEDRGAREGRGGEVEGRGEEEARRMVGGERGGGREGGRS